MEPKYLYKKRPNDLVRARHHHPTAALLLGTARDEGTTFVGVPGTFTYGTTKQK